MRFKVEFHLLDSTFVTCIVPGEYEDVRQASSLLADLLSKGTGVIYWPVYNSTNCTSVIPIRSIINAYVMKDDSYD